VAVSFTITLDVDLKSIGDKETFKRDVKNDVATAANIDSKHVRGIQVRVTALHADSAMPNKSCEILRSISKRPALS